MKRKLLALLLTMLPTLAFGQLSDNGKPVKLVTDADISANRTFFNDTVYNLSGFVYVESGLTLTIEPGTIIKGNPGQGAAATALIIARGATINAAGTASQPIIFTSISDDVDLPLDIPLPPSVLGRGLWGGVIVLGDASIADPAGFNDIEGIPQPEPRSLYGGTDDDDNSGVLTYLSIRHGGSLIGAANEINGLTLGGVGRGTTIEFIEVFQNLDDAVELFGGTVNIKNIVCAFGGDDQIDYDEGWRGGAQFIFAIADTLDSDTYGEHDGAVSPENQTPFATPLLSNVTAIGAFGAAAAINANCFNIRDNAGGGYFNSLFVNHKGVGVRVEDQAGSDSRERLSVGDMKFQNNIFFNIGGGLSVQTWVADSIFSINQNVNRNPRIRGINYGNVGLLDPRPAVVNCGPINNWVDPVANFNPPANPSLSWTGVFDAVTYMGAFDPSVSLASSWVADWTFLDFGGYLGEVTAPAAPVKVVTDADISANRTFFNDTVYNLSGFVYVESGLTLTIEPGTIIKGNPGQGAAATALIIARGATLNAAGTQNCPIIFTSISDDVDLPLDIPLPPSVLGRGLWGGVIVLGDASIADPAGFNDIEGIPQPEPRSLYGGTDDDDNSGVLTYLSIRHGGSLIGAANEINGLTLGGVGRGTTIEFIEVFQNLDDAVELFGGTVNIKNIVCAFGGDDQIDYDEGWRGGAQFIFAIADTLDSDTYGEHDGAVSPENQTPFATPLLSNVTAIGAFGAAAAINANCFNIRDNAGGGYFNSLFVNHKGVGVRVEDQAGSDSRERLSVGDMKFQNNIFFNIGGGLSVQTWVADSIFGINNNQNVNPQIRGINYGNVGLLDPRPNPAGLALCAWVDPVANFNPPANPSLSWTGVFDAVTYMGAFDPSVSLASSWVADWTFLSDGGYLGEVAAGVGNTCPPAGCCVVPGDVASPADAVADISDLTALIDNLFISLTPLACNDAGDIAAPKDGLVDISDLTALIDNLFISLTPLAPCN